jgi:hypothetical protein
MPVGREVQICLKVLDIHAERCTCSNSDLSGSPEYLTVDLTSVQPTSYVIMRPDIQDETPNGFAI